ncbi:Tyrosine-protein kinase Lyn like protein [Argiope bruennichi]|nr:Tyrosine-protein kinase Lyn like protein [Argiope bruennichi]
MGGICCHSKEAAAKKEEPAVHFSNVQEEEQIVHSCIIGIALYPLNSPNRFLLSFERGDKLIIEDESDPDWYMARHMNEERRGFAPKSYLTLDRYAGEENWFFGDTNRADAERLLLQPENEPGAFLVRHSHAQGSYALSVKDIDHNSNEVLIRHYKIRTLDRGGFFISPRKPFATLKDLVTYYFNSDGLCRRLEQPCFRSRPAILGPLPNSRDEYEVPFESLQFVRTLGKGNFGEEHLEDSLLLTKADSIILQDSHFYGLGSIFLCPNSVNIGGKLPIKWTAPEAYTTMEFTIKSDVWSFGIVLYEIFTHGGTPYSGLKNAQVSQLITKQDYRMPKPSDPDCTDPVYEIMLMCWKKDPKDRPTFEFLYHFFTDFPVTSEASYREAD